MAERWRTVAGPDGRALHEVEDGYANGAPVIVHHGTPGCGRLFAPWVADAAQIAVPTQVRHDRMVPHAHGEWLAARVPGVDARLSDDDGHLTLIAGDRIGDVHAWLLARSWGSATRRPPS